MSTVEDGPSLKARSAGFLAGVASGLAKLGIGHPFDSWKIRLQCSAPGTYSGPVDCLLKMLKTEGPLSFYKGATPPALGWAASDAVLFGSLHNYRMGIARIEARRRGEDVGDVAMERLSLGGHALAGVLAGCTVCTVITPIELIKAKLQMQTVGPKQYSGPLNCVAQVVRANGIFGLWHGFGATLLFRMWFGVFMCSYEVFLRGFKAVPEESRFKLSDSTATFLAGGLSANVFWSCCFPFDAVKNRLMTDSPTNPRYPNWRSAALQIWSEGGVRAVYRGFIPCMLRAFPTNASSLLVWETVMRFMDADALLKK